MACKKGPCLRAGWGRNGDDGLGGVEVVGERAAARLRRLEYRCGQPDHALAVRVQRARIPGQEEGAVGRVPAAAPAAEEARLLRERRQIGL